MAKKILKDKDFDLKRMPINYEIVGKGSRIWITKTQSELMFQLSTPKQSSMVTGFMDLGLAEAFGEALLQLTKKGKKNGV